MMGCIEIEQIMNVTTEGKIYLRSIEDIGAIKITEGIFHIKPPTINQININHTLENLSKRTVARCSNKVTNK